MSTSLDTSLIVLVCVAVLFLLVIGGFLGKLLYDLSKLAQTAQSTSEVIQTELEPTLKELREAAGSLKHIAANADSNISGLQNAVSRAFDTSFQLGDKLKGLLGGFVQGLSCCLKLFRK